MQIDVGRKSGPYDLTYRTSPSRTNRVTPAASASARQSTDHLSARAGAETFIRFEPVRPDCQGCARRMLEPGKLNDGVPRPLLPNVPEHRVLSSEDGELPGCRLTARPSIHRWNPSRRGSVGPRAPKAAMSSPCPPEGPWRPARHCLPPLRPGKLFPANPRDLGRSGLKRFRHHAGSSPVPPTSETPASPGVFVSSSCVAPRRAPAAERFWKGGREDVRLKPVARKGRVACVWRAGRIREGAFG